MNRQRFYQISDTQRKRIFDRDNYLCVYCFEAAEQVDHVIPYTYKAINVDWNLVACCRRCNNIASNMVFSSFIEKYFYIKRIRESKHVSRKSKRSICPDCGFQFIPLRNGATLILCSDCTLLADLPVEERLRKVETLKRLKQQKQKEQVEAVKTVAYEEVKAPRPVTPPQRQARYPRPPKPPVAKQIIKILKSKKRPPKPNRPLGDNPYLDQPLDKLISDLRNLIKPADKPLSRPSKEGRELLESLYIDSYGSLDAPHKLDNLKQLAATLSKVVERENAWTPRYLNNILNGYTNFRVTEEMTTAMQVLSAKLDGTNPLQARLVKVNDIYSINGNLQPGDIVTGKRTRCPGCLVWFVPYSNLQIYCSKVCPGRPPKRNAKSTPI